MGINPIKPHTNYENQMFQISVLEMSKIFRTNPDASELIETYPNRSERKQVQKLRKTYESMENVAKI